MQQRLRERTLCQKKCSAIKSPELQIWRKKSYHGNYIRWRIRNRCAREEWIAWFARCIWLARQQLHLKIANLFPQRSFLLHTCGTRFELPPNVGTVSYVRSLRRQWSAARWYSGQLTEWHVMGTLACNQGSYWNDPTSRHFYTFSAQNFAFLHWGGGIYASVGGGIRRVTVQEVQKGCVICIILNIFFIRLHCQKIQ